MSICSTAAPHDSTTALKPFGVRVATLAKMFDIGMTKAWGLCRDKRVETVNVDGCTIVLYASIEKLIEDLRRQPPAPQREGVAEAAAASVASRKDTPPKRKRGRPAKRPAAGGR